jgi:helicase
LLTQILQRSNIQIIGLSATIKNAADLAHWLNAELVLSDWRPVQLKEGYFLKGYIYFSDDTCRLVQDIPSKTPLDTLVVDILKEGGQALVFTNSRRSAVSMAESLRTPVRLTASKPDQQAMRESYETYLKEAADDTDISKKLADCLAHGVAFHHAGLPNAQLDFIVQQYNMKIIKVICCTPTLAAGVNTPARRVIISSLYRYSAEKGNQPISIMEYKQMAGRAGRPRYDPYGEVVILGSNPERLQEDAARFMHGEPEAITSKLDDEVQLQGHILGLIAAKIAQSSDSIYDLLLKTFYVHQLSKKQPKPSRPKMGFGRPFTSTSLRPKSRRASGRGADPLGLEVDDRVGFQTADSLYEESRETSHEEEFEFDIIRGERIRKEMKYKLRGILEYFVEKDLIQQDETKNIYTATKFGLITNQLYIPPRDAVKIREDLEYAAFLDSKEEISLHDVSFLHLLSSLASFPKPYVRSKDAAIVIPFVDDHTDHYIVEEVPEPGAYLFDQFAQENKLVMILSQWIDEAPDKEIVENFDIGAGDLHRFVENAQWLMRAVVQIDRLKVTSKFSQLLEILYLRIVHGVRPQLIPLIRLRGIGRIRARKLYHEGFTTLEKIAAASPDALERVPLIGKELAARMQEQLFHPETLGKKKGKRLASINLTEPPTDVPTKQLASEEGADPVNKESTPAKQKPIHSLDKYFK